MNRCNFRVQEDDSSKRLISFFLYMGIFVKKGYEKELIKKIIKYFNEFNGYKKVYVTLYELRTFHTDKDFNKYINSLNMIEEDPFIHFTNINLSIKTIYKLKVIKEIVQAKLNNNFSYDLNDFIFHRRIGVLLGKNKDLKKFIKQDSLDFYYIPYNEDVRKFDCLKNYISLIPERELSLIKEDISALLK